MVNHLCFDNECYEHLTSIVHDIVEPFKHYKAAEFKTLCSECDTLPKNLHKRYITQLRYFINFCAKSDKEDYKDRP